MLSCTKVKQVEISEPPFFWSEVISFEVELSYNNNSSEDHKLQLHTQYGGSSPNEAWIRAAKRISQGAIIGVSTTTTSSSSFSGNASDTNTATATATDHSGGGVTQLEVPTTDSGSPITSTQQRQQLQPRLCGTENEPSVKLIITLPIPYFVNFEKNNVSMSDKSSSVADNNKNAVSNTYYNNSSNNQQQHRRRYSTSNNYNNNNTRTPIIEPSPEIYCEWEILLLSTHSIGPRLGSAIIHHDPFAVLRHFAPISTAMLVSANTISSGVSSNFQNSFIPQNLNNSNSSIPRNFFLQQQQQEERLMLTPDQYHCLVAITCRNSCNHHILVKHVELQAPGLWKAAVLSSVTNNNNVLQQNQNNGIIFDPWSIRRKNIEGELELFFINHTHNMTSTSAAATSSNSTNQQQQQQSSDQLQQQQSQHESRSSRMLQQLMSLSDTLPITLKPTESYTFCFNCFGWNPDLLMMMLDSSSASSSFSEQKNKKERNYNNNKEGEEGESDKDVYSNDDYDSDTESDDDFYEYYSDDDDDDDDDEDDDSNNNNDDDAFRRQQRRRRRRIKRKTITSLFVARTIISGRSVLINHPVVVASEEM